MTASAPDPPAWASERVAVVPHDPAWEQRGDRERRRLDELLGPWLVAPVEHVGSTAVPGLVAKPIIDLQAAVADLAVADEIAAALAPHGWHLVPPDLDGRPWRRFLVQASGDRRTAHLHLLTPAAGRWHDQIRFRDALRVDPDLAREYATLKQDLAAAHPHDREAYSRAKTAFLQRVLAAIPQAGATAPPPRTTTHPDRRA